ncbi:hypothetical protein [Spirosoma foliorum]|uniref:Lipoprotein n=1 Tax=Spirosoma foliorum TaxID=2710596 RepID=A0A7G5GX52_9BACT|nr:hypothetical protein [Spirosoma foliorum]QMW03444.1 hypothetical protein H3H32_00280 [Spirosoma foliorum]
MNYIYKKSLKIMPLTQSAVLIFSLFMLVLSCQTKHLPFETNVASCTIQFPITSHELRNRYPNAVESLSAELTDTTRDVQVVWRFNDLIQDPRSQPYGVLITLRNKGPKMDSIRTAFEKQYHKSFQPLTRPQHLGKYEYYESDSTLVVMEINDEVQLSINQRKVFPHNTGNQFMNDVVISICYNLDTTKKERFAMKQGEIRIRD